MPFYERKNLPPLGGEIQNTRAKVEDNQLDDWQKSLSEQHEGALDNHHTSKELAKMNENYANQQKKKRVMAFVSRPPKKVFETIIRQRKLNKKLKDLKETDGEVSP